MLWLLGRNSKLSTDNKLLIYKMILKLVCMDGIQLWGSASNSNITIQRSQNDVMRTISNVGHPANQPDKSWLPRKARRYTAAREGVATSLQAYYPTT
ncbi:jg21233 [Pararge aegeria aegeria]|uniref:Jg21233 protein n=1 Tax=Pararge aegeria aegeria TaxID=348720 RepID=A0A8S4R6C4_9NEOP|nr:jg21233 [Pararge aegeria aegeria]